MWNCSQSYSITKSQWVNSLRPSDTIWRHQSRSTFAHVTPCCLTAPSHYVNQCWLQTSEVLWHSHESKFIYIASTQATILYNEFENYNFEIIATSFRGQWVKTSAQWYVSPIFLYWPGDCVSLGVSVEKCAHTKLYPGYQHVVPVVEYKHCWICLYLLFECKFATEHSCWGEFSNLQHEYVL